MDELSAMQGALMGQVGMGEVGAGGVGVGEGSRGVESGKFSIRGSQVTAFIFAACRSCENTTTVFNISDRRTSLFPEQHNQRLMTVSFFCLFFLTHHFFFKFEG